MVWVLYLISPTTALAGLCAVVPDGSLVWEVEVNEEIPLTIKLDNVETPVTFKFLPLTSSYTISPSTLRSPPT